MGVKLRRYLKNPILEPNPKNGWESLSVFNPGILYKEGKVLMFYRAIGEYENYISRVGLAISEDGYNFKRTSDKPLFELEEEYEKWSAEDPRVVEIEGTIYITYVVLAKKPLSKGQISQTALITTTDLKTFKRWGIITPIGVDDRDTTLFPEKIKGNFVMLHRPLVTRSICIAYSKDLKNWYGHQVIIRPRENYWDGYKIGAGAPPLKTPYGWLEIYHGVDENNVYRLGAVLLDLDDPRKVIARSKDPILEPEEIYEIIGDVPNVVFTCGMAEIGDEYFVYYGAADRVVGVATIKKEELLEDLLKNGKEG